MTGNFESPSFLIPPCRCVSCCDFYLSSICRVSAWSCLPSSDGWRSAFCSWFPPGWSLAYFCRSSSLSSGMSKRRSMKFRRSAPSSFWDLLRWAFFVFLRLSCMLSCFFCFVLWPRPWRGWFSVCSSASSPSVAFLVLGFLVERCFFVFRKLFLWWIIDVSWCIFCCC